MADIIKESHHVNESESFLNFDYRNMPGAGFSFDCNEDGSLTKETLAKPDAMRNYAYCLEECKKENGEVVALGVKTRNYRNFVPAVIKCSKCTKEHHLGYGRYPDTQCSCGQNYNAFGQELRDNYQDRSSYAEYGETW